MTGLRSALRAAAVQRNAAARRCFSSSSAQWALQTPPPTRPGWRPVRKIMAANRGEIAIRIFRAATELDIKVSHRRERASSMRAAYAHCAIHINYAMSFASLLLAHPSTPNATEYAIDPALRRAPPSWTVTVRCS